MEIDEGQIVAGLFRITKKGFAKGSAGDIHLAEDSRGRKIALKFIREGGISKNLEAFKEEYQTLLKFTHPNVAKARHFGRHEGRFFIASEFVDGEEFRVFTTGKKPENAIFLFIQALEGLEAIHRGGLLHLDIKSSNVLVAGGPQVKIIDFGLSMAMGELPANALRGSLHYMAPEIVMAKPVDQRADLFSLGVLFYYAITGKYPFLERNRVGEDYEKLPAVVLREGSPQKPSELNIYVPKYLDEIILSLLAKNPKDRFVSARAVINALKTRQPENYRETPEAKSAYLIPEGDRHIGRKETQEKIRKNLDALLSGAQPKEAFFWIEGASGTGKSHLLKKIREGAERSAEKINIHFLDLGGDFDAVDAEQTEWLKRWEAHLQKSITENLRPILVLADNVCRLPPCLASLVEHITKKMKSPTLYSDHQPIWICLAGESCPEAFPGARRILLKPFTKEEITAYLSATPALRNKKIPPDWVESLYNRTGGNPGELVEQLRAQDSKGLLFDLNGQIHVARLEDISLDVETEGEKIPNATHKRLSSLLNRITLKERRILEWVAVWSFKELLPGMGLADMEQLMGRDHYLPPLQKLVAEGLLEHSKANDTYFFPSHSYQAGLVYREIDEERRGQMHQGVQEYLRAQNAWEKEYEDAILCHEAHATDCVRALRAVLKLVRKYLYHLGRLEFARSLLERGLDITPPEKPRLRVFLNILLVKVFCLTADYISAQKAYEAGRTILSGFEKKPEVLELELVIAWLLGLTEAQKFDQTRHLIDETLQNLPAGIPSHYKPVLLNFKARIFYTRFFTQKGEGQNFLNQARAFYEQSEALEAALASHQKNLVRNNDLGIVMHALGDHAMAVKKLEEKMGRLRKNPNVFIEFTTLAFLAEAHRFLKDFPKAFEMARKALGLAQKTCQGKWIVYAHHILAGIHQQAGCALLEAGKKDEARDEFAEALKENTCCLAANVFLKSRQEADIYAVGTFIRNGQCSQELEKLDEAMECFNAALNLQPSEIYLGQIYLGLGECYLKRGDFIRATDYLNKAAQAVGGLPEHIAQLTQKQIKIAQAKLEQPENRRIYVPTG